MMIGQTSLCKKDVELFQLKTYLLTQESNEILDSQYENQPDYIEIILIYFDNFFINNNLIKKCQIEFENEPLFI